MGATVCAALHIKSEQRSHCKLAVESNCKILLSMAKLYFPKNMGPQFIYESKMCTNVHVMLDSAFTCMSSHCS